MVGLVLKPLLPVTSSALRSTLSWFRIFLALVVPASSGEPCASAALSSGEGGGGAGATGVGILGFDKHMGVPQDVIVLFIKNALKGTNDTPFPYPHPNLSFAPGGFRTAFWVGLIQSFEEFKWNRWAGTHLNDLLSEVFTPDSPRLWGN
jgi:hypothetical protein